MNILDIIIVLFIVSGAIVGFKRGFIREAAEAVGVVAVIILAYILKNPVSTYMYEHLPFIKIGFLKNIEILNILVYEIIAFLLCVGVLSLVLKLILGATSIIEKIIDSTIILSIPSKFAGAIIGLLYHFVFTFVIVYILSLTCFNVEFIKDSKLRVKIVSETPVLSPLVEKSIDVIEEFNDIRLASRDKNLSENDFKYQAIELFLKYDVITPDALEKLIQDGKITEFDFYMDLLNKYREK